MNTIDEVLKFFGAVVLYGGGSAAVAYFLFQHLGKKWIEARFSERMEAFKHQQALELQRLKIEVESVLSGTLKLQEREFSILPEAWDKLNTAFAQTGWVASPVQFFNDLSRFADDELQEFLSQSTLFESQKARVLSAGLHDRTKTYNDFTYLHRLHNAKTAVTNLQNYMVANGLFLPKALKTMFLEMVPILWGVLASVETGQEVMDHKMLSDAWKELQAKGEPLHKAIEAAIEERLHSHGKNQVE